MGPILFLLHVNDLPDAVQNSKVACFADDTKIFKRIDTASDAALLQQDLVNLEHRSKSSGLGFNEDKCKCQRITRKSLLERVTADCYPLRERSRGLGRQ